MNGKPVPGAFGSCPVGSKWQDNNADPANQPALVMSAEDTANMEEWEKGGAQNIGDYFSPGGALKVGAGLAMSAPVIRGGVNAIKNNKGAIGSKLKDLMGKLIMKKSTTYPINSAEKGWAWYKGLKGVDKIKAMSWLGSGVAIQQVMASMTGEDADSKAKPAPAFMNDAQRMQQLDSSVPEKTTMQKLGDKMKDPKWWTESISGLPSDTRLMRMGQLMDYYGKKPKGREAATAPAELWAKNEAASQAAKAKVLAAGNSSGSSFLSKMGGDQQLAAIKKAVDDKLGFNDYYPFNQSSKAEQEQTYNLVVADIQQGMAAGKTYQQAYIDALAKVTK